MFFRYGKYRRHKHLFVALSRTVQILITVVFQRQSNKPFHITLQLLCLLSTEGIASNHVYAAWFFCLKIRENETTNVVKG